MLRVKYRNRLVKFLNTKKIEAKIHYPIPLCSQKPYQQLKDNSNFDSAIHQSKELITLPVHQYLTKKQLNYMVNQINNFYLKIIKKGTYPF